MRHPRLVATLLCVFLSPFLSLPAADRFWDTVPLDGPALSDGPGLWIDGIGGWNDGTGDAIWANAAPDFAVFGAGGAGTNAVNLGGPITAAGLKFQAGPEYAILGDTLTLSGAPARISVAAGVTARLASILAGTAGFTKDGAGTFVLEPSALNTFAGVLTVQEGVLGIGGATVDATVGGDIAVDGGVLRLMATDRVRNTSTVRIAPAGNLDRNGFAETLGAVEGAGTVSGAGPLTLELVAGVTNLFSGSFTGGGLTVRGANVNGTSARFVLTGNLDTGINPLQVNRGDSANDAVVVDFDGAGTSKTTGALGIAASGAGSATVNVKGTHLLDLGALSVGDQNGQPGNLNQTAGTVKVSGLWRIGHWPNESSSYTLTGGALTLTGTPGAAVNPTGAGEQNGILYVGVDGTGVLSQSAGTITANGLVLDARGNTAGTDTYTLTGGTLVLGGNGIKSGSLDANASFQINLGAGTLSSSASWASTRPMTLTGVGGNTVASPAAAAHDISLAGVLSGPGGIVKEGPGTLTLAGNNTYQGVTMVNAGALQMGNGGGTGTTGTNTLSFAASAAWIINRTNTCSFAQSTPVTPGIVYVQRGGALSLGPGTTLTTPYLGLGNNNGNQGPGTLVMTNGVTVTLQGLGLGNPTSVPGTVRQDGGVMNLNGAGDQHRIGHWPSETSVYNLNAGTLNVVSGSNLRVGWDGNGILNVAGGNLLAPGAAVLVGRSGVGTLRVSAGTVNAGFIGLSPNGSSGNRYEQTGGTVAAGNFSLGETTGRAASAGQAGGALLVSGKILVGHWPTETSTYDLSGGTVQVTGNPAGGSEQDGGVYLGVDGTGILNQSGGILSTRFLWLDNRGATAGTDQYNLTGGVLSLTHAIGLGSTNPSSMRVNLGGGTVEAAVNTQISVPATLTGTNGVTRLDSGANLLTVGAVLDGPGGLVKQGAGTVHLAGANTYAGGTTVTQGVLRVAGSISHPAADLDIAPSATVLLQAGTLTVNRLLIRANGLLTGCGTVNGALENDGTVAIDCAGGLGVNGTVTNRGRMSFIAGTGVSASGGIVNDGVIDLITGSQAPIPGLINHGTVLLGDSVLAMDVTDTGTGHQVTIASQPGHDYQLQRADDLTPPVTWADIGPAQAGTGTTLAFPDNTPGPDGRRYYRFKINP